MHNTCIHMRPRDHGGDRKTTREIAQICENNRVRRMAGVKRIDKRRMEELREKFGERESLRRKLVRESLRRIW